MEEEFGNSSNAPNAPVVRISDFASLDADKQIPAIQRAIQEAVSTISEQDLSTSRQGAGCFHDTAVADEHLDLLASHLQQLILQTSDQDATREHILAALETEIVKTMNNRPDIAAQLLKIKFDTAAVLSDRTNAARICDRTYQRIQAFNQPPKSALDINFLKAAELCENKKDLSPEELNAEAQKLMANNLAENLAKQYSRDLFDQAKNTDLNPNRRVTVTTVIKKAATPEDNLQFTQPHIVERAEGTPDPYALEVA